MTRPDDPDPALVRAVVERVFPGSMSIAITRAAAGVSTHVYRLRRGTETFYLRILPEADASFAPEMQVHTLLRERGVHVPNVIYFEHCNAVLRRSVMVTTAIPGRHINASTGRRALRAILYDAGRDLAIINSIPVGGFGWINRASDDIARLEAVHPTARASVYEHLETDVALLASHGLGNDEIAAIQAILTAHDTWLDDEPACLAHGDFDATHIFARDGRYTGIIDFGEIRGGNRWYDLGHFHAHDGETIPRRALPWLLDGYRTVTPLPDGAMERIRFTGLLIALRGIARLLRKRPDSRAIRHGFATVLDDVAIFRVE